MKKLLIFLGIMLLAAGSYGGIIYDNTTDDISSSSGTMTIDGSPVGGGTHPVNLATDVTGELPHGSTSDDAAQVHGLGASVNVLGNRDASGEFIQRAAYGHTVPGSSPADDETKSFAIAFSSAPTSVVVSGDGSGASAATIGFYTVESFTTTQFRSQLFSNDGTTNLTNTGYDATYIAVGS